jgi:hypothetical protein
MNIQKLCRLLVFEQVASVFIFLCVMPANLDKDWNMSQGNRKFYFFMKGSFYGMDVTDDHNLSLQDVIRNG